MLNLNEHLGWNHWSREKFKNMRICKKYFANKAAGALKLFCEWSSWCHKITFFPWPTSFITCLWAMDETRAMKRRTSNSISVLTARNSHITGYKIWKMTKIKYSGVNFINGFAPLRPNLCSLRPTFEMLFTGANLNIHPTTQDNTVDIQIQWGSEYHTSLVFKCLV